MASKPEELEVMGVSRSGRVRKKSSKLMDFESAEEAEVRPKKASQPDQKVVKIKPLKAQTVPPLHISLSKKAANISSFEENFTDEDSEECGEAVIKDDLYGDEFDQHGESGLEDPVSKENNQFQPTLKEDDSDEEEEEDYLDDSISVSFTEESGSSTSKEHHQVGQMQSSLYLTEKSKKRVTAKGGKAAAKNLKTQRKDKGKSRTTAYMMWAKDMRAVVSQENPEMDFVAVSKRLGELWANVSKGERINWRTKALRLANKAAVSKGGMITTVAPPKNPSRAKPAAVSPKRTPVSQQNRARARVASGSTANQTRPLLPGADGFDSITGSESYDHSLSLASPPQLPPASARAGEMEPLDVASHLHLLGESLSVIGTRLKEHEGQIAVSGSLSVLLDSALCALGPLLCLTRLLPETNGCPPETLNRVLDNIAYIMPGL